MTNEGQEWSRSQNIISSATLVPILVAELSRHAHLANDGLAALGVGVLLSLLGAAAALQLALLDGI